MMGIQWKTHHKLGAPLIGAMHYSIVNVIEMMSPFYVVHVFCLDSAIACMFVLNIFFSMGKYLKYAPEMAPS